MSLTVGGNTISLIGVVVAAITLMVMYAVVRLIYRVLTILIRGNSNWDEGTQSLVEKGVAIVLIAIVIFGSFEAAGLGESMMALFSGTLGLGIGFRLRNVFSNLVSGLLLLMGRSVKPGDTIAVDKQSARWFPSAFEPFRSAPARRKFISFPTKCSSPIPSKTGAMNPPRCATVFPLMSRSAP